MEGIQSSVVLFALLLAIFGPTGSFGNKRTCFCETWRHTSGLSSDGSSATELLDIPNKVYRGWPYLGCSSPKTKCPGDCKRNALRTLGGSSSIFTTQAGNRVCSIYGQDKSFPGLSVVAKYDVSNCGARGTHLLAEHVCCSFKRCSCYLKVDRGSGTTTLRGSHRSLPNPYHVCNSQGSHSPCMDVCINYFEDMLGGSISPPYYYVTIFSKLCSMLGIISSPGARVYIEYGTLGGSTETLVLSEGLCCFMVSGFPYLLFPNPGCARLSC